MEQSRGKSLLSGGDDDAAASRRTLFAPDATTAAEPNVIVVPPTAAVAAPAQPTPEPETSPREAAVEEVAVKRRPNPWLIVLWLFGLVATIGGLAADYQYVRSYTYGTAATEDAAAAFALAELVAYQAPGIVTAGLVAIAVALGIHALQWTLARNRA